MKKNTFSLCHISTLGLSLLAACATLTARIGAGTASGWGEYQPTLPDEFRNR